MTSTCSHASPASMACSMSTGVTMTLMSFADDVRDVRRRQSVTDLVAALQQQQREPGQHDAAHADDGEADDGGHVRETEEAVAEAVDHIEERIEVRQLLPEWRQRVHRVENARKKRERHDQEVLECRDLVELVGADASDQSQSAEDPAAEQGKGDGPQCMRRIGEIAA